jgi:hypothetical protein
MRFRRIGSLPPNRIARLLPWLEAVAIVLLQGFLLRGFTNQLALHPADETRILLQGRAILAGHWSGVELAWSPVLSTVYALLLTIAPTLKPQSDVIFVICAIGSPLAVWWMLRALVPSPMALAAACAWATADPVLHYSQAMIRNNCYIFNHAIYFTALGFALRRRPAWAFGFALVACLDRAELTPWLLLTVWILSWLSWRQRRRLSLTSMAVVVSVTALFALQQVHRSYRDRSWFAFSQHYGIGKLERAGEADSYQRGMHTGKEITREDFSGSTTILGAVAADPAAFLAHLAHNAALVPGPLLHVMAGSSWPVSPMRGAFLLAVGLLACSGAWRGRRWLGKRWRRIPRTARVASLTSLSILAVALVIRPRQELLLPILALGFPLIGLLAHAGWRSLGGAVRGACRPHAGVVFAVGVLLVAPFLPRVYPVIANENQPGRETIAAVDRFEIPRNARLLGFFRWSLVGYSGRDPSLTIELGNFLEQASGPEALRRLLSGEGIDYVLLPSSTIAWMPRLSVILLPEILGPRWELAGLTSRMMCFRRRP